MRNERTQAALGGFLGLLAFLALQAAYVRAGLVSAASLFLGSAVDSSYWNAFLMRNSFLILAVSLALLLYWRLPKHASDRALTYVAFLNEGDARALAARRRLVLAGSLLLFLSLAAIAALAGVLMYSPDSWSYFELARTVFGGEFFRFTTYRSYFSEPYSTSFPLGYPVLLALVHRVFGEEPSAAVWLNVLIATATWLLILRLAMQLKLSPLVGFVLASSLILWPPYLDEVFSGRAIPTALLLFLIGCGACLSRRPFAAGLFLGLCALVRFDYLVFALLFCVGAFLFSRGSQRKTPPLIVAGFAAGISPWVLYSLIHFGRPWVSDSSWVALSALPAFAVDFPAAPAVSAFDYPVMWLSRVTGNVAPLARSIAASALRFPLVIALGLLFIYRYRDLGRGMRLRAVALLALLGASVGPYLLTGYSDHRYFGLLFLIACVVFASAIEPLAQERRRLNAYQAVILGSLAVSLAFGGRSLAIRVSQSVKSFNQPDLEQIWIDMLARCHADTPEATYIFMRDADVQLAARYGAQTGRPAAFIPSNFGRMTAEEKDRYFEHMRPFVLIDTLKGPKRCQPQG